MVFSLTKIKNFYIFYLLDSWEHGWGKKKAFEKYKAMQNDDLILKTNNKAF